MEPITVGPFKPDIPRLRSLSIKVGLQNRAPALGVLLLAMSIVLLALHIPLWLIAVAVLIEVLLIVGATLYKAWRLYKPDRMPGAFRDTTVTLNEKTLTWADDAGTNATVPLGDFKSAKPNLHFSTCL